MLGSPWLAKEATGITYPRLSADLSTEVLVIGGGIVGISAAQRLSELGAQVVLIEARTLSAGVTGNSSAKLSALHGLAYSEIEEAAGLEASRAYARLNQRGLDLVVTTAERLEIECALKTKTARTYTISPDNLDSLNAEAEAANRAGLEVATTAEHELPFEIASCIELANQAQFDPVAWVRGAASGLAKLGVKVFENSRAVGVKSGEPCTVEVETGDRIRASQVVVATHLPFLDRGLQFIRVTPKASHAVAAESPVMPRSAMYLSIDTPTRSIRALDPAETGGPELLFVGGDSLRVGTDSSSTAFDDLERLVHTQFRGGPILHRWMAHDYMSADRLPYIGKLQPLDDGLFVATGFSKWGLAAGAGAGSLLAEMIAGEPDDDNPVFEPSRLSLKRTVPAVVKEGVTNAGQFLSKRASRHQDESEIAAGTGGLVREGHEVHAVYRRLDGAITRLSARCTHLGCMVSWNDAAETWDCPCHGSRFDLNGDVISGPATSSLERVPGD